MFHLGSALDRMSMYVSSFGLSCAFGTALLTRRIEAHESCFLFVFFVVHDGCVVNDAYHHMLLFLMMIL